MSDSTTIMDFAPLIYCLTLPPVRDRLITHLPAMDVVSLSLSLGIELTDYEKATYLNPTKDVLDSSNFERCPLHDRALCTFLGRDLLKPAAILRSKRLSLRRAPDEIRLMLLVGCLTVDSALLLLQCRRHIINTLQQDPRCVFYHLGPPNDEQDNHIVLMPSIGTTLYLFNPYRSPSDHSNSILYLEARILGAILEYSRPPTKPVYVCENVIEKSNTFMYQDSFTIRDLLWHTDYPYFLFQIKDDRDAVATTHNIFLVTYPGIRSFRGPWMEWKSLLIRSIMNQTGQRNTNL